MSGVPIVLFMCSNEVYPESWAPAGQPRVLKAGCGRRRVLIFSY